MLQAKLEELYCWSNYVFTQPVVKKYATMSVCGSRDNKDISTDKPALCFGDSAIMTVNKMKDLGVIADNHLDMKLHTSSIVAREV